MKKALIVVAFVPARPEGHMNWLPFRDEIRKYLDKTVVDMTSLTDLVYDISNEDCKVIDTVTGNDVSSYDFVIIRNVGKTPELGIALANYLSMKNIPFTDSYLETRGAGKLACAMLRLKYNLPTPRTIYASAKNLKKYINDSKSLSYPFVLKADNGKKGRDNYLIKSSDDLDEKLALHTETPLIAQEFIESDGDFRALVMNGEITLVIKRFAKSKDTHLNNTSQGATADLMPISVFSSKVQNEILKAAEVEGLQVAGVDVIIDTKTSKHYFLEVNRAPQIGTGAFADKKTEAYANMIGRHFKAK